MFCNSDNLILDNKLVYLCIDSDEEWIGSRRIREALPLILTSGNLVQTHPELFQEIVRKFADLPPVRFKHVVPEFLLASETIFDVLFGPTRSYHRDDASSPMMIASSRKATLIYFLLQMLPVQNGTQSVGRDISRFSAEALCSKLPGFTRKTSQSLRFLVSQRQGGCQSHHSTGSGTRRRFLLIRATLDL